LKRLKIDNPRVMLVNDILALKTIRENDSLKINYQQMYNQAVVLLVSYFGDAVEDLFLAGVKSYLPRNEKALRKEPIKVSLRELVEPGLQDRLGSIIVRSEEISFQDMQSIARAFEEYCGVTVARDEVSNTIATGQACRHAIVHAAGIATSRFVKQVESLKPTRLGKQQSTEKGKPIRVSPEEVERLADTMTTYLERLAKGVGQQG